MRLAAWGAGVLALFAAAPALADPIDDMVVQDCHYQWSMRGALRERSDAERKLLEGGALYYCRNEDTQEVTNAQVLEAPHEDGIGLCFFGAWAVGLGGTRANGYYVTRDSHIFYPETVLKMRIKDGATCPRQDDPSYVVNEGVPDGLFLQMLEMWQAMLRSPKAYDGALADDAKGDLKLLKDWLTGPDAAAHLRLIAMEAGEKGGGLVLGARPPGLAVPLKWMIDASSGGMSAPYFVDLDWRGGALKIVAVGEGKY